MARTVTGLRGLRAAGDPWPRAALAIALAAALAGCTSTRDERRGGFVLRARKSEFAGHSATQLSLWYGLRRVAASVSDVTVDPRVPERVLFASRARGGCGTFLFDGRTGRRVRVSSRVMIVHPSAEDAPIEFAGADPWSSDGRYVYAGNEIARPVAIDLKTTQVVELSDAVTSGGKRVEMRALVWSPDGRHLAVELAPEGYNGRRDLIAVTPETLGVEYVGSMDGRQPRWTTRDFRWEGDRLAIVGGGHDAQVFVIPEQDLQWRPGAPLPAPTTPDPACPG